MSGGMLAAPHWVGQLPLLAQTFLFLTGRRILLFSLSFILLFCFSIVSLSSDTMMAFITTIETFDASFTATSLTIYPFNVLLPRPTSLGNLDLLAFSYFTGRSNSNSSVLSMCRLNICARTRWIARSIVESFCSDPYAANNNFFSFFLQALLLLSLSLCLSVLSLMWWLN